jgi:ABC-2 type transport system permease protein
MNAIEMKQKLIAFGWMVRREFWEHKALWIVPAVTALLLLVAATWAAAALLIYGDGTRAVTELANVFADQGREVVYNMVRASMALLHAVVLVVVAFFLLDCLYGDRRDRSVLFWRSLPVSDLATVGSKLFIAVIAAPAVVLVTMIALEVLHDLIVVPILVLGAGVGGLGEKPTGAGGPPPCGGAGRQAVL